MKPGPKLPPPPITYRMMQAVMSLLLKTFGLSCRNAFNLCSKQMDGELTKREALRLRIHLLMCGLCRRLPDQFRGMRALIQTCQHEHTHDEASLESMSPESKQRIAEGLKSQQKS